MFKGTVTFCARIKGNGLTFPLFEFNPNEPGVDKFEINGPNGDEILSTVYLVAVTTPEDGKTVAMKVHTTALNRISFFHNIAIENGQKETHCGRFLYVRMRRRQSLNAIVRRA
jgi:hypothetical protein